MAVLDINGLLNGRRLRKCSDGARWAFVYYYLLSNGYARIELNYEAIAEHFVSFRGSAPSEKEVQGHFAEYRENHLIFIYRVGRKEWGQWDTERSKLPRHKTAVDRKTPPPPEKEYRQWLVDQHDEDWGKYHWNSSPEVLTEENQSLSKRSEDLEKVQEISEDLCRGVGVGVGVGEGKTNPLPPLGPAALVSQENQKTEIDIDPWQAGQATAELLGLGGQQKALARDACAAVKRRKPEMRFTETPEFVCKLWREYDSLAVHAKVSLKTFLGEIGRFMDSDSWRAQPSRASPEVDEYGGHYEQNGPQKVYVTKDGKRMPGYIPPPKAKAN